jgi:Flp pilus assembly protein TadG
MRRAALRPRIPARPQGRTAVALLRSRRGSPAIEFALVAPVMIVLLTGSYDITQLLIAQNRILSTAQAIVEIATELSIQPDQSMSLTTNQAFQAESVIYAIIPGLKSGSDASQFWVSLSAVVFVAIPAGCTAGVNCTYVAHTAWSTAFAQSTTQVTRPCGVIAQIAPTQQATIANLPSAGMTALTSMVVADVSYTYRPLFTGFVTGPVVLHRTAFLPPRTGLATQYVQYDLANGATDPFVCPGYL